MIAEADYDALLGNLYAGAAEPERLRSFLDRLSAASGSHLTVLIREDARDPASNQFLARGLDPALRLRYDAEPGAEDDKLWFQRSAHAMRPGAVLNGEDWASPAEIRHTRYYDSVLREMDTLHSAALCGMLSPERAMLLTPCRSSRAGPYGSEEMALFRQVGPHWVNACTLMVRFEHLQAQVAVSDRRRRGLFLLDADLRWIGGNETAEAMVASGWLSGRRGARLDSRSAVTHAAWQGAQRRLATDAAGLQPQTIPVYDALASLVAFASLQPYGAAAPGEGMPSYVLFVRPLHSDDDADIAAQLRALFDLTIGEATLAVALRRHGDLHQAAASLGLTDGSARTRLQAVYEKTTMHRQTDLLRMLDALADAIA
jgi:hypothetical protein